VKFREVVEMVESHGFNRYGGQGDNRRCVLGKRVIYGPKCDCNDSVPELIVRVHNFDELIHAEDDIANISFNVVGESNGSWLECTLYSVRPSEFSDKLPISEECLSAMWSAGYFSCKEK